MGEFRPAALLSVRSTTLKFWGVKRKKKKQTQILFYFQTYT